MKGCKRSACQTTVIFGRPFVKRFTLCYQTVVSLSVLSVTLVYCDQTVGWMKMKFGTEVGLSPDNIVLDGNLAPLTEKGAQLPTFRLMFIVAKRLDGSRCHFVQSLGLGLGNIVLDADPAPPLKGHRPPFSAHVCCGQTVAHLSYC